MGSLHRRLARVDATAAAASAEGAGARLVARIVGLADRRRQGLPVGNSRMACIVRDALGEAEATETSEDYCRVFWQAVIGRLRRDGPWAA